MADTRIGIVGAGGRMGRMLIQTVAATSGAVLSGGIERPGSEAVGRDLGELAGLGPLNLKVGDDAAALIALSDVLIDFTSPASTTATAKLASERQVAYVIGTTGISAEEEAEIAEAATHTPIVKAGNMSLGVNLLVNLVEQVAKALDPDFDIEIVEMHHKHKVDAPSGTALMLGEAAAKGREVALETAAVRVRDGHTGVRQRGTIGFQSLRGGDVVGDHTVIFAGNGERIEVTHKATNRSVFASGAVKAALWTKGRKPGLYSMRDVLGL